jgi:hypothetical protein
MASFFSRALARPLGTALITLSLIACATTPATPELAVRERATQQWEAMIAGDFDKAYMFMPPSYRAVTTRERFRRSFGGAVQVLKAEVVSVQCDAADKCVALMKVEAKAGATLRSAGPLVTHFEETWVREDGKWWLFPTS